MYHIAVIRQYSFPHLLAEISLGKGMGRPQRERKLDRRVHRQRDSRAHSVFQHALLFNIFPVSKSRRGLSTFSLQ